MRNGKGLENGDSSFQPLRGGTLYRRCPTRRVADSYQKMVFWYEFLILVSGHCDISVMLAKYECFLRCH
jgi:hypothetical protein